MGDPCGATTATFTRANFEAAMKSMRDYKPQPIYVAYHPHVKEVCEQRFPDHDWRGVALTMTQVAVHAHAEGARLTDDELVEATRVVLA